VSRALTARAVESAKPDPDRRVEIPDGALPGLYLVLYPSGIKSYAVRYRHEGKPRKLTIGPTTRHTLAEARTIAREALQAVAEGQDPAGTKQAAKAPEEAPADTVEAVCALFIERYAKPKNRSWQEVQRILNREVVPRWQGRKVGEIARRDVIKLVDDIADRPAPIMAGRVLAHVRKLFNWCASRDMVEANPAAGVQAPVPTPKRDRVLSDDELVALWRACDDIGPPFGPFVRVLILTAARRDEVAGMAWDELDTDAAVWTLPPERAKNNVAHVVPLPAPALDAITSRPRLSYRTEAGKLADSPFVFTTTGKAPLSGFSKAKTRLDAAMAGHMGADVAPWRLHDIRRTAATGLQRLGVRLEVTEAILNHVSGSRAGVAGVYQRHHWQEEKRTALDAWTRHVLALVEGREAGGNVVALAEART